MAIDPSIPLQVNTQPFNPLMAYAQAAAVRDSQDRNTLTNLAIQDKQRELAQSKAVNDAYKANVAPDGTLNRTGLVSQLAQGGQGAIIPGLQKSFTEMDTATLNQQKSQLEVATGRLGAVGQVLGGVTDQASYDAARQWAASNLGADAVKNMPAVYDPQLIAQKRQEALTVQQQLENTQKNLDYALRVRTADETQRHNIASEANTVRGQDMGANHYDPNNGVVVNTQTGMATPAIGPDGKPVVAPGAKLNESQANATAFGARALDAQNTIRQLEAAGVTSGSRIVQGLSGIPVVGGALGAAANTMGVASDQQQSYDQAQRNFISAVLRKESGAAISESEFANERQKYFPQPGDSAATVEQKARARDLAVEALKAQAGPGAGMIPGIIGNANQDDAAARSRAQQQTQQQPTQAAGAVSTDAALAELRRRAATNPALAKALKDRGY